MSPFPFAAQQLGLIARAIAGEPVQYALTENGRHIKWVDLNSDHGPNHSSLLVFAGNHNLRLKPAQEQEPCDKSDIKRIEKRLVDVENRLLEISPELS